MEHIGGPIARILERAELKRRQREAELTATQLAAEDAKRTVIARELCGDVEELLEEATENDGVVDAVGAELILERLRERWGL
jgi:hypothetical protein